MSTTIQSTLDSVGLLDAYTDFILSRQSKNSKKTTLDFYYYTAGKFLEWAEKAHQIKEPEQITGRIVREYIAELVSRGKKDTTVFDHARAIKTLLRFLHTNGYMQEVIKFDMPKLQKKRLPVLDADQLDRVLKACNVRDKAIVMFLADSGLRRGEAVKLDWDDIDMQSGLVLVRQGKGGKDRSAVIGARTRRALLAYRRTLEDRDGALFKSESGTRLSGQGIRCVFRRLSKKTGIHITPHAMRRTFTILSLRAEMDVLHLQALLGHTSLAMVYHYAQMVDEDLLQAHKKHSPIDNLEKLR